MHLCKPTKISSVQVRFDFLNDKLESFGLRSWYVLIFSGVTISGSSRDNKTSYSRCVDIQLWNLSITITFSLWVSICLTAEFAIWEPFPCPSDQLLYQTRGNFSARLSPPVLCQMQCPVFSRWPSTSCCLDWSVYPLLADNGFWEDCNQPCPAYPWLDKGKLPSAFFFLATAAAACFLSALHC